MVGPMRRSWLLVPMSEGDSVLKAGTCGSDVVVLDLCELVPEGAKPKARLGVRDAIDPLIQAGAEVFVQVDRELLYADIKAAVWPGLAGVVLARAESPQDIIDADRLLGEMEDERGLLPGTVQIVASLETARGKDAAAEIARASSRVWGITLGRADLVMDLRPEPSGEIHLMPYLMQRLIIVANAVGATPLGAWWWEPARGLLAGSRETYDAALRGRGIGFKGSFCLRPDQVEPLNRGFSPTEAEVGQARRLDEAYRQAEGRGSATAAEDGLIVDLPMATQARELLAYASACTAREEATG